MRAHCPAPNAFWPDEIGRKTYLRSIFSAAMGTQVLCDLRQYRITGMNNSKFLLTIDARPIQAGAPPIRRRSAAVPGTALANGLVSRADGAPRRADAACPIRR